MMQELSRIMKMSLYWLILGVGIAVRIVFAHMDRLYRAEEFWSISAAYWTKIGAVTMVVLILIVLIHLFSIDHECRTEHVISSTPFGRKRLFWQRQFAVAAGATVGVSLLAISNVLISMFFGRWLTLDSAWIVDFLASTGIAFCGSVGLSVVASAVCDISKSQPITLCICGIPFIISLFVNSSVIKPLELFWFFRYGFFTELMRGRPLQSMPGLWVLWYGAMLVLALALAFRKRKERKEL